MVVFTTPDERAVGIEPAVGIVTAPREPADLGWSCVRVAWRPDEVDMANLIHGGTIWLSTWGGLPPHMLEVQAPPGFDGSYARKPRIVNHGLMPWDPDGGRRGD